MPLSPRSTRSRAATTTTATTTIVPTPADPQYSSSSPSTSSSASQPSTSSYYSSNVRSSPRMNPHSHFGRSKSSSAADMLSASTTSSSSPPRHSSSSASYLTAQSSSHNIAGSSSSNSMAAPSLNLAALNALDANGGLGSPSSSSSKRGRSSSILSIHEIKENYDDALDQSAMANLNADWVNYKGAWLIHIVLIVIGKILVDSIPGIEQDTSWTIVLQGYLLATYIMFHFVEGVPFESNSGVWDRLTMWEQIDGGEQYTPAKKWLTSLPICLFLLSTHYTRYDRHPALFSLNLISLVALALIPKLPQLHRQRLSFGPGPKSFHREGDISTGANTPVEISMQRAHLPSLPE